MNICKFLTICLLCVGVATVANAQNSDNFDSYTAGAVIPPGNDWIGWGGAAAANGIVTAGPANSPENSLAVIGGVGTDQVLEFGYAPKTGAWDFSVMTYVPSEGKAGAQYFNLMNRFVSGSESWSNVEVYWMMDPANANVDMIYLQDDDSGAQPIQYDAWVEVSADIDLDANTVEVSYGGVSLGALAWTDDPLHGIDALDIYPSSADASIMYYDDVSLVPEPTSFVLLIGGLFCLLGLRRRK